MTNETNFLDEITRIIDNAFGLHYEKGNIMQSQPTNVRIGGNPIPSTPVYESIEDYTVQTGKRFRMTKEQKQRELSREEAFNETHGGSN